MPLPTPVLALVLVASLGLGGAGSAADAGPTDEARGEPLTVVLLPAHVHVVELGIKVQESEEWSSEGSAAVDAAVRDFVDQSNLLDGTELPVLAPDERAAVDEFLAVATLVQMQAYGEGTKRITSAVRDHFGRSPARSLSFLRDRTGVDYALVTLGTQAEQSKELVALGAAGAVASVLFPPLLVLPASSASYVALFLIELGTGELRWFNGRSGYEFGGYNFTDLRDPESARKVIAELLETYPEFPSRFAEKPAPAIDRGASSEEVVSPPVGWFALQPPVGWRVETDPRKAVVVATRDGRLLNEIKVELRRHASAFPESEQKSTRHSSPDQLSQLFVAELNDQGFDDLQIAGISHDAQLAGRAAFKVRFSHRLPAFLGGARIERVTIGAAVPAGLLLSQLSAPQLDYFAQALPHFEESTRTIELVPRRSRR